MNKRHVRRAGARVIAYALLSCTALIILTPLVWTVVSSFRPVGDIFSHELPTLLSDFTLQNYHGLYKPIVWDVGAEQRLFPPIPYARFFLNSVFVSTAFTLLAQFFSSMGGFGFG